MSSNILSVVVPAHNIADHVDHLAAELAGLDAPDVQFVVVDDGSSDESVAALAGLKHRLGDFVLVEGRENRGAGVARNLGFPHATGKYTLFFDADDHLHPDEIRATIAVMEHTGADVSINSYDFIRDGDSVNTGMNSVDHMLWNRFSKAFKDGVFTLGRAPHFLRFTNYPWNKLIRTGHYQRLGLDPFYGETKVNNDILGHWNTLLNARKLVLVDEKMVTHHVSGARDHLSNRFGAERLELFTALQGLHELMKQDPLRLHRYAGVYWVFVRTLVVWAQARMDQRYMAEFRFQRRELLSQVSFEELSTLMKSDHRDTIHWLVNAIG